MDPKSHHHILTSEEIYNQTDNEQLAPYQSYDEVKQSKQTLENQKRTDYQSNKKSGSSKAVST